MATNLVCVDACIAAKWVLPEEGHAAALALLNRLQRSGRTIVGPPHLFSEVTSAIRASVHDDRISATLGREALDVIAGIGIEMAAFPDLYRDAFDLSTAFALRRSYDAEYVALARHLGCELWTADLGLVRAFGPRFDWIRTLDA